MTAAVPPPRPAGPSTPEQIADVFDVLAAAAHWFDQPDQGALFPVVVSPVERALAERIAVEARAQLARLDPPALLTGVAVWAARHPDAADTARTAAGRTDVCWGPEAAS